jgi:psiF repeat-containing protein
MFRTIVVAAMLAVTLPATASFALTPKQKMETCKFGANDQKLQGKARNAFIKKCMANKDDPRGPAVGAPPPSVAGATPPPPAQH